MESPTAFWRWYRQLSLTHQQRKIADFLLERPNQWIRLPEILALGIAQYGARILENRRKGLVIENRTMWVGSKRHSWFRIVVPKVQEKLFADRPETERRPKHVLEIQRTTL
jgi:hypothetical protein